MAISEESRYHLYQRLEEVLGAEEAATLMEHLPPVGWADVATKRDIDALAIATKRDIDAWRTCPPTPRHQMTSNARLACWLSVTATREQLADLRSQLERDLRSLTWRLITVLIAAMSIVLAGIKL